MPSMMLNKNCFYPNCFHFGLYRQLTDTFLKKAVLTGSAAQICNGSFLVHLEAIQIIRNAVGVGVSFPGKKRYGRCTVQRYQGYEEVGGSQMLREKRYITKEWPHRYVTL